MIEEFDGLWLKGYGISRLPIRHNKVYPFRSHPMYLPYKITFKCMLREGYIAAEELLLMCMGTWYVKNIICTYTYVHT